MRNMIAIASSGMRSEVVGLLASGLLAIAAPAAAQERVPAVWKEREISFIYRSSNAIYECGALRDRVASILYAIGARADLDVSASNCDEVVNPHFDPNDRWDHSTDRFRNDRFDTLDSQTQQSAIVHIRLMSPTEVTPELQDEQKKLQSRRELVARVTGDKRPLYEATGEFPAEWQTITLSRKTVGLEPAECELLEQMSHSVFRELGIRDVKRGMSCNPRGVSHLPPQMTVVALISAPWANPAGSAAPAKQGDAESSPPAAPNPAPAQPAE